RLALAYQDRRADDADHGENQQDGFKDDDTLTLRLVLRAEELIERPQHNDDAEGEVGNRILEHACLSARSVNSPLPAFAGCAGRAAAAPPWRGSDGPNW